jgi:hypothetical protein
MLLDDLLRILREDILHDRSDQVAGDTDYLWSDTTLVAYIDEAQRRFARRSLCIRDATTPSLTQVTLVTNQTEYTLNPSVIAVISARFTGDTADLARGGHAQFDTYHTPDTYFFNPSDLSTLPPGKPLAWATDEGTAANSTGSVGVIMFRAYPVPSSTYAGQIINLRVCRMPQTRLVASELDVYPEIPEEYHIPMLDYAAYLALRIVDHDLGNPARANEFLTSFEGHVIEARNEMLRKMFTPHPWGFGRDGWSFVGN